MSPTAKLRKLNQEMFTIARGEVERRARVVLKGKNAASFFIMAMGDAAFYDCDGEPIYTAFGHVPAYMNSFFNFLEEWDERLFISGSPMRIDGPDEPIRTDW